MIMNLIGNGVDPSLDGMCTAQPDTHIWERHGG